MTIIKSFTLIVLLSVLAVFGFAQTSTTKTTSTTTTTKTVTPAAKTQATTTGNKTPQASTKTSTTKKTTKSVTTKSTKPTTTKTSTTTNKSLTPAKAKTSVTTKKESGTTLQTKTATPPAQKTEPTLVVPKQGVQLQQVPAVPATGGGTQQTQTSGSRPGSGTNTTPSGNNTTPAGTNTQTTGGRPGTSDNSNTNTNQNGTNTQPAGGRPGTSPNTNTNTTPGGSIINTITEGEASSAIKEALMKGVQEGVNKVSVPNGYFGNNMIKIPFPAQVSQVESALRNIGMGSLIDNAVLSMNRAAESAATQAGPIFLNSIKQMTVSDAVNIVSNKQPDAATQFLKRTTTESLVTSFKPSIKTALDKTLATKYWGDITTYYNKIPFVSPINTDLPDYVTRKAIDGLFYMVALEEAKIRKDPAGTANDIIKTVFGKVKL